MYDTCHLRANDLMSKWGFHDGDLVADVIDDRIARYQEWPDGADHRAVLVRAVREFLLPRLEQDVEVYEIQTIHNPIRVRTVGGVEIDVTSLDQPFMLTPEFVEVSVETLWRWLHDTVDPAREGQ